MARQADACWQCGTDWASEEAPPTTLKVIHGGASAPVADAPRQTIAAAAAALAAEAATADRPLRAITGGG